MEIPLLTPASFQNAGTLTPLGRDIPPHGETVFEALVALYRGAVSLLPDAPYVLLRDMRAMSEARAAILAVREVSALPVFAHFSCCEDGRTDTGSDILAALIVMEGMGAAAFGISCPSAARDALLERLSPYTNIPLFYLAGDSDEPYWFQIVPIPHDPDVIPCASEREARFITPDVDVGETLECTPDLLEDILRAEEEQPAGALKITIQEQDDVDVFAEHQYAIQDALCLHSDVSELLELALRAYQGRAFYDGTGDLDSSVLSRLSRSYGLIVL
ncbi:MAG: 5-methyltetrahydrofolate--homocysteine methyltransferase [Oscillospiraceae bacterium]|nr:5-methyltetrahydrofolate--homocysteine methyltransferase [Oscillospiraceae bacterium]